MLEQQIGRKGHPTLLYNAKPLHSLFDPFKEAQRFMEISFKDDSKGLYFILGLGLGYHLQAIVQHFLSLKKNPAPQLVVLYFDERELQFFKEGPCSKVCEDYKNLLFVFYKDRDKTQQTLELFKQEESYLNFAGIVSYSPIANAFKEESKFLKENLIQLINYHIQNLGTEIELKLLWVKNILQNMPHLLEKQKDVSLGKDAVLVSAGPSLKQNLPFLKNLQGKAPLVVVDTALKPVLEAGITPDIIVSCDSQIHNYYDFLSLIPHKNLLEKILLVADITHYHKISELFSQIHFCSAKDMLVSTKEFLNLPSLGLSELESGGSVSSFALSFLLQKGVSRVLLVGQDFGYEFITHSVSSIFVDINLFKSNRYQPFWTFYQQAILLNKDSMLGNLENWFDTFFSLRPLKGIQKDPYKKLKNAELYNTSMNFEGSFSFKDGVFSELQKEDVFQILKKLESLCLHLRESKSLEEFQEVRKKASFLEQKVLEDVFVKPDLYKKRHKNHQENLYLGSLFFNVDQIIKALKRAFIEK